MELFDLIWPFRKKTKCSRLEVLPLLAASAALINIAVYVQLVRKALQFASNVDSKPAKDDTLGAYSSQHACLIYVHQSTLYGFLSVYTCINFRDNIILD